MSLQIISSLRLQMEFLPIIRLQKCSKSVHVLLHGIQFFGFADNGMEFSQMSIAPNFQIYQSGSIQVQFR